jgi:hypothetical protein
MVEEMERVISNRDSQSPIQLCTFQLLMEYYKSNNICLRYVNTVFSNEAYQCFSNYNYVSCSICSTTMDSPTTLQYMQPFHLQAASNAIATSRRTSPSPSITNDFQVHHDPIPAFTNEFEMYPDPISENTVSTPIGLDDSGLHLDQSPSTSDILVVPRSNPLPNFNPFLPQLSNRNDRQRFIREHRQSLDSSTPFLILTTVLEFVYRWNTYCPIHLVICTIVN